MTFEETVAMVFQPGMSEIFGLALAFCMAYGLYILLVFSVGKLVFALIHRYIWPGEDPKKEA